MGYPAAGRLSLSPPSKCRQESFREPLLRAGHAGDFGDSLERTIRRGFTIWLGLQERLANDRNLLAPQNSRARAQRFTSSYPTAPLEEAVESLAVSLLYFQAGRLPRRGPMVRGILSPLWSAARSGVHRSPHSGSLF